MDNVDKSTLVKLGKASLAQLPQDILCPRYDPATLTPGIVHIGLGNFHRAHQAWYLHRLMQMGKALDWAIIGAGVKPYDEEQREKLAAQDYLTTLIELSPEGSKAEVTASMIDYVPIRPDNQPLIRQLAEPEIRIVGLTTSSQTICC